MKSSQPEQITQEQAAELVRSVPVWHHRFEIAPGVMTPGIYDPGFLWDKMELPEDLSGQRVLDIGASDGFFSMNLRRRGAQVVAVDYRPKNLHGFGVMERITGLDFDYRQANIYEITAEAFGTFDIVVFLGVLYHLPDMMKALFIVRSLCSGQMFLETHCAVELVPEISAARYYREDTLNQDPTNFWSPNVLCLEDMLYDAGFDLKPGGTRAFGERCFAACQINENPTRLVKLALSYGLVPPPGR